MQGFAILLLVAFSAVCDGVPNRLSLRQPSLPFNFLLKEKRAEKRVICTPEQYDNIDGCPYFKAQGYCDGGPYQNYVQEHCPASCGKCEMPPTPPPKVEVDNCLKAHNAKRALHGAPPLVWDATLTQNAKEWAEHLVNLGRMVHSEVTGQGENLYRSNSTKVGTCVDAVDIWYGEEPDYSYENPPQTLSEFFLGPPIGHFTQIVWKDTKKVGVALSTKKSDNGYIDTFIVARYSPQGNILRQFQANVARPKKYKDSN